MVCVLGLCRWCVGVVRWLAELSLSSDMRWPVHALRRDAVQRAPWCSLLHCVMQSVECFVGQHCS